MIVRYPNFDKTVDNINDRNAISPKVDNMIVVVKDAIADAQASAGVATYRWSEPLDEWILISKSSEQTIKFATEEVSVNNGSAMLSHIPQDNHIWNVVALDGNRNSLGNIREEDLTVHPTGEITGIDVDGIVYIRCTYAYGTITQQLNSILETKANKDETEAGLATKLNAVQYNAGDILSKLKTVDGDGSGLDADKLDGYDADYFATKTELSTKINTSEIGNSVQPYNEDTVIDGNYVHTDNNYTTEEKTKLANIEAGATADQTAEEIESLYESRPNTNKFTDALKALLTLKKVKDLNTDAVNNKLVITYIDDTTKSLDLNAIVTDVNVSGATLDASTNVLTLINDEGGPSVTVDLSDFVNSSELSEALDTKEDAFSKNSAFNKNFGTTAGTVAEGNHNHDNRYLGKTVKAVDSDKLNGYQAVYYLNASNLNSGTISNDRLPDVITSNITGNAATASKLTTGRLIALSGDVTGSASFNGSGDITINATVNYDMGVM